MSPLPGRRQAAIVAALVGVAVLSASTALAAGKPGVDPAHVVVTLAPGASTTLTTTVTTPAVLPRPDIYFLADTTGSTTGAVADVATNATSILNQIAVATTDPQFGVGQYTDAPGPFVYRNDRALSADRDAVTAAITGSWVANGGGDGSRAQLSALHELLGAAGFRSDSSRIVVWFGEAPGSDPVCASTSGGGEDVTEASVTAELVAAKVKVLAVSVTTGLPGGLNGDPTYAGGDYGSGCPEGGPADQAARIAAATGGQALTDVAPEEVASTIVDGLKALPATVTPSAACDGGASVTFTPAELTVDSGAAATFGQTLHAAADATAGERHCTVTFLVNGRLGGDTFVESTVITVPAPDRARRAGRTGPRAAGETWSEPVPGVE